MGYDDLYWFENYNSSFGSEAELRSLINALKERGIGTIADVVINHRKNVSNWVDFPKETYNGVTYEMVSTDIVKNDDGGDTKKWATDNGYSLSENNDTGEGWGGMRDLNYDNKDMREAMIDAMKFWIVDVGIDGFRCDVADGVPADFWKDAIDQLRAAAGDRKILMLAEGKNVDNFTIGGFDMNYGWDYKDELVKVFKGAPASDLIQADKAEYDSLPAGKVKLRFTTNHDHSTEATPCVEFTNDRGAMAAYVASIFPHGGALIYGSQEVGYPKPINFFKHVPVDWTAKPEIYQEYKQLIGLYNEHPALRKGDMTAFPDNDVLVFEKKDAAERFLVVANLRNEQKTVNVPADWMNRQAQDQATAQNVQLGNTLTLTPFQYFILAY